MLYNSDKTHSFILVSLFSLIFCLFNEGHLFILVTRSGHFEMSQNLCL